jgi:hypothetical protein
LSVEEQVYQAVEALGCLKAEVLVYQAEAQAYSKEEVPTYQSVQAHAYW